MALGESVDLRSSNKRQQWKRFVSSTILLAFVACLLPIPTFSIDSRNASLSQDADTPYPCQGGHCGCDSAMKCWTSCCCTTPAERELWAMQRGITPPSYAIRPKSREIESQRLIATESPHGHSASTCSNTIPVTKSAQITKDSCCKPKTKSPSTTNKKCSPFAACSTTQCEADSKKALTSTASSSNEKRVKHSIKYWLGISAAKCQGMNWDFLQVSWMPDEFPEVVFPLFSCFYWSFGPLLVCAHDLPPDPPPPKVHAPLDRTI